MAYTPRRFEENHVYEICLRTKKGLPYAATVYHAELMKNVKAVCSQQEVLIAHRRKEGRSVMGVDRLKNEKPTLGAWEPKETADGSLLFVKINRYGSCTSVNISCFVCNAEKHNRRFLLESKMFSGLKELSFHGFNRS